MKEKKKLSLAAQIFIALVLAVIAGLLMQKYANFAETYIKPFGTIFLNLLKFIVVPIVLFCIFVCSKDNGRNEPVKILQGNASGNHVRILKFFICRNTSD